MPLLLVHAEERGKLISNATHFHEHSYSTIMVPLDGSSLAEQALVAAQTLATQPGATLELVSVIQPMDPFVSIAEAEASTPIRIDHTEHEQLLSVTSYLHDMAQRLSTEGLHVHQNIEFGAPAEQILLLSETGVDLIVMSSHGRDGLLRMWLGSVAMKVMHAARVLVLLVRATEVHDHRDGMTLILTDLTDMHNDLPVPA